jgi:hypothetical protein
MAELSSVPTTKQPETEREKERKQEGINDRRKEGEM